MRLAFHEKQFLVPTALMGPARERDNNLAGPISARGRSAVQNRLGDIAQQQPAILVSIRRSVLAKGRDGSDVSGHRQALQPVSRSVAGSCSMIRNRSLLSAELLKQAREWADELTALEVQGPHDLEPAWRRIEARYGIPFATLHSLRYRKDLKDIWASLHHMLRMAVEHERSRRMSQLAERDSIAKLIRGGTR